MKQGIHVLLNNCPKLTHLSLTGVQAFLRDELLAFCREAPPEFNEHQRDVFCVFSGPGVGRLREFLNQQKAHQSADQALSVTTGGSDIGDGGSIMGDGSVAGVVGEAGEDENPDSDGVSTPVIAVDVGGNVMGYTPGATPAVPTPPPHHSIAPPPLLTQTLHNQTWQNFGQHQANLSHSAPATTGPVFWNIPAPLHPQGLGIGSLHSHSGSLGSHQFPSSFGGGGGGGQAAGAQQVTGMMGATVLHEVDEEDDGDDEGMEGSEIMDSR